MRKRPVLLVSLAAATILALSGCGTPPWESSEFNTAAPTDSSSASSTPTAESSSDPEPTATTSQAPVEVIANDLANGSTARKLTAGNINVNAEYWSTLSMDEWTAGALKPVTVKLSTTLTTDDGNQVYISKVAMNMGVYTLDGAALNAPKTVSDQPNGSPGAVVKDPYSYEMTFIIPAIDPEAAYVELAFTYEFLLQTTPDSTEYSKQTASDTITVAIFQE